MLAMWHGKSEIMDHLSVFSDEISNNKSGYEIMCFCNLLIRWNVYIELLKPDYFDCLTIFEKIYFLRDSTHVWLLNDNSMDN